MRKICLLLLVTILLFTLSNESYARRRFNEPPDYAYLRGRIAEFRSIFQILGRKSFFDVLGVYEKNFKNPLANTIGKRIEKYGLEKMKSELSLIGPLGKKFLSRIPNQKTEKKQIKFIKKSIKNGLEWYLKEISNMKDFEILKELEFLELKLLLVPKIIRVKRIEEKNRFLILPMIDFRKKNFEIKGFDQIFKKPKLFCLARLITLLVSAQYFSKGHAAVGIISLAIGKYQKQISIEYIELLTMAIASDLDSLNAE